MTKLLLLVAVAACLCAAAHGWKRKGHGHGHGHGHRPRPKPRPSYCKGQDVPGNCKPQGPDELKLCSLNDTTCGDNMTCTDSPYFLRGLTLTDINGTSKGTCVNQTMEFDEGLYCCKPGCPCLSGGTCSGEVVGNFTTNTTGVCVPNACELEECTSHTDCTDPDFLCVQGNDTSYCLVPQSRPQGYTCPGLEEAEGDEDEDEDEKSKEAADPEEEGETEEDWPSYWPPNWRSDWRSDWRSYLSDLWADWW